MQRERELVKPPRAVVDEHTLIAQKYAGCLVGHPYRQKQQSPVITVDMARRWREPGVVADDCIFCVRLTDEDAVRRVAGYQYRIDVEVLRGKWPHYAKWCSAMGPDVPEPHADMRNNPANYRRFCELFQDAHTVSPPNAWRDTTITRDGWKTRPFPMVNLPLRIKRKLCIEWNHLYLSWMAEEGIEYDFLKREFWREAERC